MSRFRKRPAVVTAERFFLNVEPWPNGVFWYDPNPSGRDEPYPAVRTFEGPLRVTDGDWIVTGTHGERYPVKPEIFDKIYEPIDEAAE